MAFALVGAAAGCCASAPMRSEILGEKLDGWRRWMRGRLAHRNAEWKSATMAASTFFDAGYVTIMRRSADITQIMLLGAFLIACAPVHVGDLGLIGDAKAANGRRQHCGSLRGERPREVFSEGFLESVGTELGSLSPSVSSNQTCVENSPRRATQTFHTSPHK